MQLFLRLTTENVIYIQKQFQDTEFWSKDESMLVIASQDDLLLGHIELFMTVNYLDEYQLSYQVYALE